MKFVCLNCETYMTFQKVEKPTEASLGVFFVCGSCDAKFSMVTNPGETQMVNSLGVQLGGRTEAAAPLEMTRGGLQEGVGAPAMAGSMAAYLNDKIHAGQQATATADAGAPAPASTKSASAPTSAPSSAKDGQEESSGGCPFSTMVAQMGLGGTGTGTGTGTQQASDLQWSADAQERLGALPSFVQPMVRGSVEAYARKCGYTTVTLQVMDDSKNASTGMTWEPDAEQRLKNIPDFIQPMARKEIERLARERGATTVTAEFMDEAKEKFMKFM